jgi:hypothetical protein
VSDILYPYTTLQAELTFDLGTPVLDGMSTGNLRHPESRTVNLFHARHPWRRVKLPITVAVDTGLLKVYEDEHGETVLMVVANCRPTNTRQALTLRAAQHGEWEGALELDRDNFRDQIELKAVLTPRGGPLLRKPVGFAPVWSVYFDEPPSFRFRGTLAVRWVNFKSPPPDAPSLVKEFPDSTHVVSFDGGMPQVLLNSAFPGLEEILKDQPGRRGTDKALHDMQRTSIARAVWLVLVGDSLAAVKRGDEDEPADWPDEDWQREVLERVFRAIDPGKSDDQLLRMAANDWRSHPGAAVFHSRAEAIIGDIVKANETLRRFAQTYGQEAQP